MAEEAAQKAFPRTISFSRDPFEKTFRSRQAFETWRTAEQQFWQTYVTTGDQFSQAVNQNMQLLANVLGGDDATFLSRVENFSLNYLSSESGFSKMIDRLRSSDPNVARMALFYFFNPQNMQWQNNREVMQAMILVGAYRALGDPLGNRERLEEAVGAAERLRDAELARKEQFDGLFENIDEYWRKKSGEIEEEFKQKFDGYEAKMALSAPTHYWSTRAEAHENLAQVARKRWKNGIAIIVIAFMGGSVIAFTGLGEWISNQIDTRLGVSTTPLGPEPLVVLSNFLKRALVLGSLLGLGVWWLRQLLRELRSHEHLAEDASERVTMIETYAAIRATELEAGDLAPILNALYRPAATGLVVDDGGGPALPLEVLLETAADSVKR